MLKERFFKRRGCQGAALNDGPSWKTTFLKDRLEIIQLRKETRGHDSCKIKRKKKHNLRD